MTELKNSCELDSINDLAWLEAPSREEVLSLVSHEQTGHDQFGITASSAKPQIDEVARKLVNEE
jgi:hypothetical protein